MATTTKKKKSTSGGIRAEGRVGLESNNYGTRENYLARPKSKPSESLRGKLNKWDNGYAEFIPVGTRESNRTELKRLGDSSFYKSAGKKESSFSCHLNVDGESADPVGEMDELYLSLTREHRKQPLQLPEGSEGRLLLDTTAVKVWLDRQSRQVQILATLECSPQIERALLQAQGDMNRTIGRYREEIVNNANNK